MKIFVLLFLVAVSLNVRAANVCEARNAGLDFVLHSQIAHDTDDYRAGEWKTQINIHGLPYKSGVLKKGPFEDANAFTLTSVQSALTEIYSVNPDARIRRALTDARDAMPRFETKNGGYNFWPKNSDAGPDGHLPTAKITHGMYDGFVTIPADADDTALAYYVLRQDEKILGTNSSRPLESDRLASLFSRYTDSFRIALPRFFQKQALWTGAYLTWLERGPLIPIVTSAFFPESYGPRIVLGENTVDCVVNANVLRTLKAENVTDTKGFKGACNYLNSMAEHERYNSCGFYYPDTYWMHYATVRAYSEGVECLKPAVEFNLKHLLKSQRADGSWHNEVVEEKDTLATALAASALVRSGSPSDPKPVAALSRAVDYLLTHRTDDHWTGGVFFSAGHPARNTVLWSSDAFTTALVTELLFESQSWLKPSSCH